MIYEINQIYSTNEGGYNYFLNEGKLQSYLAGKTKPYSMKEKEALINDIQSIYEQLIGPSVIRKFAVIVTGISGSGKYSLIKQLKENRGNRGEYIPLIDDKYFRELMKLSLQEDLQHRIIEIIDQEKASQDSISIQDGRNAVVSKLLRKWKPGLKAAMHIILANLIRKDRAFYCSASFTDRTTTNFLRFLKGRGYTIKIIHLTASLDTCWRSIQNRDEEFVNKSYRKISKQAKQMLKTIHDTFFIYATQIDFRLRSYENGASVLAAQWHQLEMFKTQLGHLAILELPAYEKMKRTHDQICSELGRVDLLWQHCIEAQSK